MATQRNQKVKGCRKCGRNRAKCEKYRLARRREKNKARRAAKREKSRSRLSSVSGGTPLS